jgi:AhpD family alkylhydroperoxidase
MSATVRPSLSCYCWLCLCLLAPSWSVADSPGRKQSAKAIPRTRPELKRALEALKHATPRLPLPPATADDQISPTSVNNGRARKLYLPATWQSGSFEPDPDMTLDYVFKTRIFWIVSRSNNCHYCLGHQEHKLASAGLSDDQIAELDSDWNDCPPQEKAAFALARKMTLEPHRVDDADVDALRPFFNPAQIIELVHTIASYNSTNRWTDSLGLPQDHVMRGRVITFDTPTSEHDQNAVCTMLPHELPPRPPLETREEVQQRISLCRQRTPRVPIPDGAATARLLGEEIATWPAATWMRPLALFPATATKQIRLFKAIRHDGDLSQRLKAQLCWIAARENRAWYALAKTQQWLEDLGASIDDLYAFADCPDNAPQADADAWRFAAKLTSRPQFIVDEDIARLRQHYSDAEVAQIVYVVCVANMFDRLSETLALPLE